VGSDGIGTPGKAAEKMDHLNGALEVLGEDFWPEGLEVNWPSVATLMQYAKEQGLINRLFTREKLFAPTL
jgi:4,5-dihydroxyphthalate decarboxylase